MKLGENLQKLRKEKGLSQEALAEMLNVSRQAVSKWESGQSYPETDKLIALSSIFGVTLDSLVKDDGPQSDTYNTVSTPFWMTRGSVYEYKSKRTMFGLPLVHIHIGSGLKRAKGIVAIGNIATGVVSIGLIARGVVSAGLIGIGAIGLGTLSLGLLAAGAISVGVLSIGAIAVGIFALGAVSVGMFSIGACAVASHIAIGDHAYGHIAVGRVAEGVKTFVDPSSRLNLSSISAEEVRKAIFAEYPGMWSWIADRMTSLLGR